MPQIDDFVAYAPVPADVIEEYRGRVPDELVEIWEQHGYGITWEPSRPGVTGILYRLGDTTGLGSLKTFLTLTRAGGAKHVIGH